MQDEYTPQKAVLYDLRKNTTLIGKAKVAASFEFIEVNEVLCSYLACTPAELTGVKFTTITLPEDNNVGVLNAEAVKRGDIDHYQFPKRYKPEWLGYIVYVIIDVLGVRNAHGKFLYYDVEILEISKSEYLKLKRVVLKRESENLQRLLSWTGGLNLTQLKGLAVWVGLVTAALTVALQIKVEFLKAWLTKLLQ